MITTIEESMEMGGILMFIQTLLRYIATQYGEATLALGPRSI